MNLDNQNNMLRNTKQKEWILNCLKEYRGDHITAEEIVDILKTKKTPVSKATVYRFLSFLAESGVVRKYLVSDNQSACYQFIGENKECQAHYHLICDMCGQIVHFENVELSTFLNKFNAKSEFSIDGAKTAFYGKCRACALID